MLIFSIDFPPYLTLRRNPADNNNKSPLKEFNHNSDLQYIQAEKSDVDVDKQGNGDGYRPGVGNGDY